MIKAVVFDMDGVLVFSEEFYQRRRSDFLELHGMRLPEGFDATGSNDQAVWRALVPDDSEKRERLRLLYLEYAREHRPPWHDLLSPGVRKTLLGLRRQGMLTGICSSSRRPFVEDFVATVGLGTLFDDLVTGDDCDALKPDPEPYRRATERLGVRPDETLVVEDSPIGIRAGKAAGALVCALRQPDGVWLDQSEADLVIDELPELVELTARPSRPATRAAFPRRTGDKGPHSGPPAKMPPTN